MIEVTGFMKTSISYWKKTTQKTTEFPWHDLRVGTDQYKQMRYHYNDVIMGVMASQITSLMIIYSIVYSGADQRKYQSSASLAFVRGIHRWPVNSLHKGPVTRKMFSFDDIIMKEIFWYHWCCSCMETMWCRSRWRTNLIIFQNIQYEIWNTKTCNSHNADCFNTLGPRQNGHHSADDILKCIFLNENVWIAIKISLKFVPMGPIDNISALVQIMAWRRTGDKPLSEPMTVRLLMHICVTQSQGVNITGGIELSHKLAMIYHWTLTHWGQYMAIYVSLVQIMTCCLVGAKPLSAPILEYC